MNEQTAWTTLVHEIISIAGTERDLRSLLGGVARRVVSYTAADACVVHIVDHDTSELVLVGAAPDPVDALTGTVRVPLGEGIAGWVAQHGRPAVVEDKGSDPRCRALPDSGSGDHGSLVSVPMLRPGASVVGVVDVHAHDPGLLGADTVGRLEEVASVMAAVVEGAVLQDRLRRREAELEAFAARTIELQELDRRRIAGEIHDGISQRLVSAWYHLRAAMALSSDPAVTEELTATTELLSEALEDSRRAITGLRPALLDDLGLRAAITSVAANLGEVRASVDLDEHDLAPHVETAVFRIAQETLQNVVKHAGASHVDVSLRHEGDTVVFTIADDGVGFDPAGAGGPTSFGLAGMHERASLLGATLVVRSAPGRGTSITLRLPADRVARSAS